MKKTNKQIYEAPTLQVVEVKQEGVICASPGQAGVQKYTWHNDIPEE